jgi:hypothetical protein
VLGARRRSRALEEEVAGHVVELQACLSGGDVVGSPWCGRCVL